ncbi:VOC family protein [Stappia sp. TSB10GB4]|uniref:VOC family protein n=1 Tax=Stappia sp. TSB10GB4 TaxID=2003584 RepID=UPI0016467C16|nr:VOC family protein [Stappia sp. TSB10GB4]
MPATSFDSRTAAQGDRFDMAAAPLRVGLVTLAVRDSARVAAFYREILGLEDLGTDGLEALLGAGGVPLLRLRGDAGLVPAPRSEAGLFHTAFLLPSRADLGRWLAFAAARGLRLQGASDHKVSEAVYLADPEGNGIEIYADRTPSVWTDATGAIVMSTDPLDAPSLLAEAAGTMWHGAPAGTLVGHVHLQVGATDIADAFYSALLGFDIATRYPGASFYGSGGYHHQLAGNIWNSRGAGPRKAGCTGLAELQIVLRETDRLGAIADAAGKAGLDVAAGGDGLALADPWGTRIRLTAA